MPLFDLALTLFALLLTPGPTNTLMGLAGMSAGFGRAKWLIGAELAAYLSVVVPLALLGKAALDRWPSLGPALALAAGLWVLWLAAKLWRLPKTTTAQTISARTVFVTTLLNPKGLVIGLVLLPSAALNELPLRVAVTAGVIVAVALVWTGLGSCMAHRADCPMNRLRGWVNAVASLWLAALGLGLLVSGFNRI